MRPEEEAGLIQQLNPLGAVEPIVVDHTRAHLDVIEIPIALIIRNLTDGRATDGRTGKRIVDCPYDSLDPLELQRLFERIFDNCLDQAMEREGLCLCIALHEGKPQEFSDRLIEDK